jgi:hypothetical protein
MGALNPVEKYPGIMQNAPYGRVLIQRGYEGPEFAGVYMFKFLIFNTIRYMTVINKY